MKRRILLGANAAVLSSMALFVSQSTAQQSSIRVRVNRWIGVQQVFGDVSYTAQNSVRPARVGDRLQNPGDSITTGKSASAALLVDTGIGTINVLEKTKLLLRELTKTPNDGHITRLDVVQGQVRLKLRRFTNRESQLELRTPAGLSSVRGTEFGVSVQPSGKTAVATLEGAVATAAQGVEVSVPAGFQNFTIPGEAPTNPVPLRDDPRLEYRFDKILADGGIRNVRLMGRVDPVNSVTVDGQPEPVDRNGFFRVLYLAPSFLKIKVVVTTPLGKTQTYELALQ
ncbi:FecR family protein [Myxacorys almedinensis]|uniref:FecR protein domain-containing protein n=1 Tax=Myxacorys almedinensis A TaxID=2690445 RepID=A0A8J7Z361_9CYAN|nr:FecR domain-containing protein [Myxacorys almedinensis]NDJ19154.1 hypothetical protein [Myxacorys almedinensis A]